MSVPTVPPRPSRANGTTNPTIDDTPQIPPRPARKLDPSPIRDVRSPLNELPNPLGNVPKPSSNLSDKPERPPIVALPSIGQEGAEYASFDQLPSQAHGVIIDAPQQTSNVADTVPLHAPKASVSQSTARSRIEPVTRTDSTQAAAAGIGRAKPADDVHNASTDTANDTLQPVVSKASDDLGRTRSADLFPLKQKTSFHRSDSHLPKGSRPASVYDNEHDHGIPEIGMQVPLLAMAGDVQAPSPGPTQPQHSPGVGFFNDGSARAHQRRKSGRKEFAPAEAYGLHGHSQEPHDQFERDWYAKHPDKYLQEGYHVYGRDKPETALSSMQLERMVTQTDDIGMGTSANVIGTPGEEIGYAYTDQYASQVSSAAPSPQPQRTRRSSSGTKQAPQSPLRKASYPWNDTKRISGDGAVDDNDRLHFDPPEYNRTKQTGGGPDDNAIDFGPQAGNTEERGGWFDERGEGTPVLASDEIFKRPGSAYMLPAVAPEPRNDDDDYGYYDSSRRNSARPLSRPSSRPSSVHYDGGNLHRFISHEHHDISGHHTPLEEIEEYEPLIPEESGENRKEKPKVVKKQRPGLEHHHFPSQDIWEDTPMSLQYHTTVGTPEPPREASGLEANSASAAKVFEPPEAEQARKEQAPYDMQNDAKTLIKPNYAQELRPGMQRYPSKDVWEDAPSSVYYTTTVGGPQMEEIKSPPEDRPTTSAMAGSQDDGGARATTGYTQQVTPSVPARPQRTPREKSKLAEEIKPESAEETQRQSRDVEQQQPPSPEKAKAPPIPDRPKPTVPARPSRPSRSEQETGAPLAKSTSAGSVASDDTVTSPPAPKTKPVVPARPGGEKIAALKSGFMSDLNNRLKLGPQGLPPKAQEAEREVVAEETPKEPLADARKGRARGPARRKPAASPAAAADEASASALSISTTLTMWSTDGDDSIQVPALDSAPLAPTEVDIPRLEKELSMNAEINTAEPTLAEPMSAIEARGGIETHGGETPHNIIIPEEGDEPEPTTHVETANELPASRPELGASDADIQAAPVHQSTDDAGIANATSPEFQQESEPTVTSVQDAIPDDHIAVDAVMKNVNDVSRP